VPLPHPCNPWVKVGSYGLVGSNWPPHQVTRPSHPHGDRRHRQHGEGGAELRISHPAISKTISDIEGTLGVRLLDRGSQGAELTAYGEVLLRCGTNIFDEMQQGLRSLEYLSDPNSGEVRLGCTDIILHSLVPTIARRFSKEHPGVQLDVKLTNPGHHQIKELRERKIIASGEFVGILPTSVARLSAHRAALRVLPLKSAGPRISAEIVFLKKCGKSLYHSSAYLDQPNGHSCAGFRTPA
jgi:DNA-binding transcriptional LysR family regulator